MEIYSRELTESPPADDLVQMYFIGNKWWSPPSIISSGESASGDDEIWENPYPEVTE